MTDSKTATLGCWLAGCDMDEDRRRFSYDYQVYMISWRIRGSFCLYTGLLLLLLLLFIYVQVSSFFSFLFFFLTSLACGIHAFFFFLLFLLYFSCRLFTVLAKRKFCYTPFILFSQVVTDKVYAVHTIGTSPHYRKTTVIYM